MAKNQSSETTAPLWLRRSLGGLCYWMGHRNAMYRGYPLGESAMVAELCNLLFANLPTALKLKCEVQYSKLLGQPSPETGGATFTERSRLDLCVCGPLSKGEKPLNKVSYVFEVKRGSARLSDINNDLRRLLEVKTAKPEVRAFLLLISEGTRPGRFVNKSGFAIKKEQRINGARGYWCVRAAMKAVPMLKKVDVAHYACAIEVLVNPDPAPVLV